MLGVLLMSVIGRGIITTPFVLDSHGPGQGFTIGKHLSAVDVNYLALYWDKLVIPICDEINSGLPKENELLMSDLIYRPRIESEGNNIAKNILNFFEFTRTKTFQEFREKDKLTDWFVQTIGTEYAEEAKDLSSPLSLRLDLYDMLPVPRGEVQIDKILKFKSERKDELNALHELLDDIYKEFLNMQDLDFARAPSLNRLNQALVELNKVSVEKWKFPVKFNLTTNFEVGVGSLLQSAATTYASFLAAGGTGAVLGASIGFANFLADSVKLQFVKRQSLNPDVKRIEYLSSASKSHIIGH